MTEDEMVGWHHQLNAHEFDQILGNGEGQGSLVCCSPWGHKELDTTDLTLSKLLYGDLNICISLASRRRKQNSVKI